jgi:hypothetical protein
VAGGVPRQPEEEKENGHLGELHGAEASVKHEKRRRDTVPVRAGHGRGAHGGDGDRREEDDGAWLLRRCEARRVSQRGAHALGEATGKRNWVRSEWRW